MSETDSIRRVSDEPLLDLRRVSKSYPSGGARVQALSQADLRVAEGAFVAVSGPSGSGKTTLMNLIGCIDHPTSGEVFFRGQDVSRLDDTRASRLRLDNLGFVFQDFQLIPVLSAFENVEYPLLLQGRDGAERRRRVERILEDVGLSDCGRRRPGQLSGGQQQRVAIARALVTEPALVLADEPTANLDSHTGLEIVQLMRAMNQRRGTALIFSTHDPRIVDLARERYVLEDGRLRAC